MGYCIMRNEKIKTMSHCISLENEHNRASSEADLYKERFSPNIDWEKTDQNIYLVRKNNWKRIIDIELRKHNIKKRKDAVLLIDSIYTASPEVIATWNKETLESYFKDCLEFHQKHFGLVINAVIHLDETTPHLHVDDIPLIQKEDGSWKLSAKEVIGNRSKMSKTQSDFYKEVGKKYGLERGEEKSLKVHKEVSHKLAEDNKKLKAENSGLEERNNQLNEEISSKEEFSQYLDSENQNKDNLLKSKEIEIQKSKGINCIYDTYRRIVNDIVVSSQSHMLFIPLSEWISSFDEIKFVDKLSDEMEDLISSLKNELENVARLLGYTHKDYNGNLLLH